MPTTYQVKRLEFVEELMLKIEGKIERSYVVYAALVNNKPTAFFQTEDMAYQFIIMMKQMEDLNGGKY